MQMFIQGELLLWENEKEKNIQNIIKWNGMKSKTTVIKKNGDHAQPHGLISLPARSICSSYSSFSIIMRACSPDRCSLSLDKEAWLENFSWSPSACNVPPILPRIHPSTIQLMDQRFTASIYQSILLGIVRLPKEKNQVLSALKDLTV